MIAQYADWAPWRSGAVAAGEVDQIPCSAILINGCPCLECHAGL